MGLFTEKGPPDWHPAPVTLKNAAKKVIELCKKYEDNAARVALTHCLRSPVADTVLTGINTKNELEITLKCVEQIEKGREIVNTNLFDEINGALSGVYNKLW